ENKKIIAAKLKMDDTQNKFKEAYIKENKNKIKRDEIVRSFPILGFGIWNCDNPLIIATEVDFIAATFKNKKDEKLSVDNVTVIYKKYNSVFPSQNLLVKILPNTENMIWTVKDEKFMYVSYDDVKNCNITNQTKEYTFQMRTYPEKITSVDQLRAILLDVH
ncbi:MAG: hypothetical protein ABL940_11670, partial [Bacteroidia bacterium]